LTGHNNPFCVCAVLKQSVPENTNKSYVVTSGFGGLVVSMLPSGTGGLVVSMLPSGTGGLVVSMLPSGTGGLVVSMLASGTQNRGF
jgi:hypothetical protein